jgi:hypothetical protein
MRIEAAVFFAVVLAGCAGGPAMLVLPGENLLVRDQLVLHADFPLAAHHRLFDELTAQRSDLCRRLALPASDEPIQVYLFDKPEKFRRFMRLHHPDFPERRAFFVETDARLTVYAQWGDRMADDLRHEVAHGYLHSVVPKAPLWLDEGIAECFEVPRGSRGLNRPHLERLMERIEHEHWQGDLGRLERLDNARTMTQDDYAEAWAWVHFMIESGPERLELLRGYLADLRRDGVASPLSARLAAAMPRPAAAMIEHVRKVNEGNW